MSLNIIQNPLTKNRCYQKNVKRTPIGIQVHSIGCAQGTAKALVDSWNNSSVSTFVTYVTDADEAGRVYQCGPEDIYTWADGGYGNRNLITIETMESDFMHYTGGANYVVKDDAKFKADILRGYNTDVLLCADICKRHNWNPLAKLPSGLYLISSHNEGRLAGLSTAHVDTSHIWDRFGLTMDKFRNDVAAAMGGKFTPDKAPEIKWYRVRKTWTDESSQLGAFEYLDRAKESCPYLYSVFDSEGKSVYTNKTKPKNTQASAFQGISEGKAAEMILELVKNNDTSGILYSVTAAQMILESGYVKTELAKAANNCFGMKETLSGNTWQSVWDGKSIVRIRTPEEYTPGVITYIYANFRKYPCIEDSIKDHSAYLLGAMNGSRKRYAGLTDCKNYREAISLIKSGGYATDSRYVDKICSIIQRYNLDRYDNEATPKPQPTPAPTPAKKHDFGDATCYVQTGAYKTEKYLKAHLEKLAEAGFSGNKVNPVVLEDGLTHVILGSYKLKRNAEKKKSLMWDAGFDAKIIDI